jgi:exonuclease SbcD
MTFKLLHTSDWHLGQHFYGKSRANEHQQFLTWLLEQTKLHDIDAIIVAGDIFDTGTPPSYAREMYFDFIVQLHQLSCELVIVAGNHDSVAMLGESKQLLASLSTRVIPAVTDNIDEQVFGLENSNDEVQAVFCAIPFIRPRDVMKSQAGQSANDKQTNLQQAISDHYQGLFEQAEKLAKNKLPIIATGHLTTVGVSTTESVRDIYIGTLEAFPAKAFPSADYIALGHIHRSQKVAKTEHIRYSGSPIALSFDESSQAKQVIMVEFEQQHLAQITELTVPCFQPMKVVKTTLDSLNQDINNALTAAKLMDDKQKLWLDVEIESADYLSDLTARIETITAELPIEVLLVRRSKKSRQQMPSSQKKITLNELSLQEVFETRLSQEDWSTEEELSRKKRLTVLFEQALNQTQEQEQEQQTEQ